MTSKRRTFTYLNIVLIFLFSIPLKNASTIFFLSPKTLISQESFENLDLYWADEIKSFTPGEGRVYKEAQQMRDLKIGFDFDGVIISSGIYPFIEFVNNPNREFESEAQEIFYQRLLLRPGIKPLLIGLMHHNKIKIVTSAPIEHLNDLRKQSLFLEKFFSHPNIEIKVREDVEKMATERFSFSKDETGNHYIVEKLTNKLLKVLTQEEAYQLRYPKLPDVLDIDVLVEDNALLGPFLKELDGSKKVIRVRQYLVEVNDQKRHGVAVSLKYAPNDVESRAVQAFYFQTSKGYEIEVLRMRSLLTHFLKFKRPISFEEEPPIQYFFETETFL